MENAIALGLFERAAIQRKKTLSDARHGRGVSGDPAASSRGPKQNGQPGRVIRVRGTLTISI